MFFATFSSHCVMFSPSFAYLSFVIISWPGLLRRCSQDAQEKEKHNESPLPWFSYLGGYPAPIKVAGLSKQPRWRHLHKQRQNALRFEPPWHKVQEGRDRSRQPSGPSSAICLLRSRESTGGGKREEGLHHDSTWKVWTATRTLIIRPSGTKKVAVGL